MSAQVLLSRLEKVKKMAQPGKWVARCPAHTDKTPSLSIRELDDGTVLIHDFGGCSVHEVLGAVGMDVADLFPPKAAGGRKPERRPFTERDALLALSFEASLVLVCAGELANGRALNGSDLERLHLAQARIEQAVTFTGCVA